MCSSKKKHPWLAQSRYLDLAFPQTALCTRMFFKVATAIITPTHSIYCEIGSIRGSKQRFLHIWRPNKLQVNWNCIIVFLYNSYELVFTIKTCRTLSATGAVQANHSERDLPMLFLIKNNMIWNWHRLWSLLPGCYANDPMTCIPSTSLNDCHNNYVRSTKHYT